MFIADSAFKCSVKVIYITSGNNIVEVMVNYDVTEQDMSYDMVTSWVSFFQLVGVLGHYPFPEGHHTTNAGSMSSGTDFKSHSLI